MKRISLAALAALVLAGSALAASPKHGTVVKLGPTTFGTVLVDSAGATLYMYAHDSRKSACYGACASTWPPLLTTGLPSVASGLKASLLGTTKRTDGKLQVTFAGHPLYRFSGDSSSGQANGQGMGGVWFALTPTGSKAQSAGTQTPPSYGGGSGY
ncbi:MAG: hypothetical protein JO073_07975 [Actinobacteria bacterium]|nr:hypothetical protein [Actinomycetota bacterium]